MSDAEPDGVRRGCRRPLRARQEGGAKIVEDLHETTYGERQYGAEDLDGHRWLFSRHVRDVAPNEWGAIVAAQ